MPSDPAATHSSGTNAVVANLSSFARHSRAENKAPSTITTYAKAGGRLCSLPRSEGMPDRLSAIRREHVESFLISLQERGAQPATVSQRYRSLQQFFRWLVGEGELTSTPMATMKPPHVPEPPLVIRADGFELLLSTCAGTSFEDRRAEAASGICWKSL